MSEHRSLSTSAPSGIEHANIIDAIVHDAASDEVRLTMVERRPWDDSPEQLFQLQDKFNAYVSFILDGEMADAYPALVGKKVRIRVECVSEPTPSVRNLLDLINEQLSFQGIDVEGVIMGGGCGPDCGCAR